MRHLLAVLFAALAVVSCADTTSADLGPDRVPVDSGGGRPEATDSGGGHDADPDTSTGTDVAGSDDGAADGGAHPVDIGGDGEALDAGEPTDVPSDVPVVRGQALGVSPTSVFFTYTAGEASIEEIVEVRNIGDEAVTVTSVAIEGGDTGWSVYGGPLDVVVLDPGQTLEFGVRYRPPTGASESSSTVRIENSAPAGALLVPLGASEKGGTVEPDESPPCVRIRPTTIDFGRVARGGGVPVERTFEIANCGTSDIRVSRLDRASVFFIPTPANFQWTSDPLPMTIPVGSARTVTVTYEAGRAGLQTGAIDVRTNVTGSETVRVNLRATSEPPPIEDLDVHLVLNWDVSGGSDVDFHFVRNGASLFTCDDCYFANMTPDWGVSGSILDDPFLDYDDLEGPGPENINVDDLADGTYKIVVHYYSDTGSGGGDISGSSTPANATVEVYIGGVLRGTYGPTYLSSTSQTWDVATLDWPSATLTPLGRVYTNSSGGGCF